MEDILDGILDPPVKWNATDNIIKVIGVGGGGCNAVNTMFRKGITGCNFVVCNTDADALNQSPVPTKIQLGQGLGAGTNPSKGRDAALNAQEEIDKTILGPETKMLFITAGMGGGTGTGASPVIAQMAKKKGILTVAVVTLPFHNESRNAHSRAIDGLHEMEKNVDSLLVIDNEKIYSVFPDELIQNAFPKADEVLCTAVQSIIDIIKKPGYVNVDFKDIQTMMHDSGMALMGCGSGSGANRLTEAVRQTFESPLLNNYDLKSAKNVLINITSGNNEHGLTMKELEKINEMINDYTGGANTFKTGYVWDTDPEVGDKVTITAIVTGLKTDDIIAPKESPSNLIFIDKNYQYVKNDNEEGAEDVAIPDDKESKYIGFNSNEGKRLFHFTEGYVPVLLDSENHSLSELENTPAIKRNQKQ